MITIQELLRNRGLTDPKTKLVRHKAAKIDLYNLYLTNKEDFLLYQSQQGSDRFNGLDYIVSFIGEQGTLARFIGVFRIISGRKLEEPRKSVDGEMYFYEYEIEEISGFDDLKERVIINWGDSARAWIQSFSYDKAVVQIHPGIHYQQFTDYSDVILTFRQLQEIITNQYSDWKKVLSITKGIYLISDISTGKLYVGSAYGENGIWGRWSNYVLTNGHGNNKSLKELISIDSNYANNFQYSILGLLPKTIKDEQAIKIEKQFKDKFGKNACALNNN